MRTPATPSAHESAGNFPAPSAFARLLPRPLAERYETARRDVATVLSGLAGRRAPPFATRRGTNSLATLAVDGTASALAGRPVRIVAVARETPDAICIEFVDPTGAPFVYLPGQFVTVVCSIAGREHRRAYSLCSSPLDSGSAAITVKRVPGGVVSNHLNDHARAGDTLRVLGPSGSFTLEPDASARRHVVLVAGGSGITPVMSIARTVLHAEPGSTVWLVYGNRSLRDVIFADALADLAARFAGRFTLRHVLSDPPDGFAGARGMLDAATLARELAALGPSPEDTQYFVCGPEGMMLAAREALAARGVPAGHVREERFTQPHLRVAAPVEAPRAAHRVTFRASELDRDAIVAPGQTLLEAGLGAGVAMPFSCAMGGCGACRVRLTQGSAEMEEPNCLSASERAEGYVLACVARPTAAARVEVGS